MEATTISSSRIRRETESARERSAVIESEAKCAFCGTPLLNSAMYYFPCAHGFHAQCLLTKVFYLFIYLFIY